ncbi:MAG: hypothetical protein R6T93_08050 [Trueperaceae bacterium]
MTHPVSGRSADAGGAHRVDDPEAARLLIDEAYRNVLDAFIGRDRSVGEAAEELRLDLDATLYRVRRLHRVGLLVHSGTRPRAGRPVKLYRAAYEAFFVPFEALPYADLEETFLELHLSNARVMARAAARALRDSAWSGYRIERGDDGQLWMRGGRADGAAFEDAGGAAGPADAMVELRLAPDDAEQLNRELVALIERYIALDRSDEGPANRMVTFASVPLEADG